MRTLITLISTLALLGGCASGGSVSENQCIASDWQTLGYRDGVAGYRSSRLLKHQDACVQCRLGTRRARILRTQQRFFPR